MAETKIMIVAGEASGDLHGAHLVKEMRALRSDLAIYGMGGKEMAGQGVELLYDAAKMAVVGIFEVISHLGDIRCAMQILVQRLAENPPHLLVLIDYPDFNLILAKKAKKLNIPIFYYISPQVWAWRSGRVKKIGRLVSRMAVILPFEQDFYRRRGVAVDFVGNPLLDFVTTKFSKTCLLKKYGVPTDSLVVGILPGSRQKEIKAILPIFLATVRLLTANISSKIFFLLPLATTLVRDDLKNSGLDDSYANIKVISGDRYELMSACDVVMAVSGTVTLELAILKVPMVVVYRVAPLTWLLGRRFIKVKYASLVNLTADREVVPELLQDDAIPIKIYQKVSELLTDHDLRQQMKMQLATVCERLGEPGASVRAARIALELTPISAGRNNEAQRSMQAGSQSMGSEYRL